jgi:hypothetical protein
MPAGTHVSHIACSGRCHRHTDSHRLTDRLRATAACRHHCTARGQYDRSAPCLIWRSAHAASPPLTQQILLTVDSSTLKALWTSQVTVTTPTPYKERKTAARHEDVLRNGGKAPHILNLGTIWSWTVSFTHRPLYPQYEWVGCLGGPQSPSGHSGGKDKKFLSLPGIETRWSSP